MFCITWLTFCRGIFVYRNTFHGLNTYIDRKRENTVVKMTQILFFQSATANDHHSPTPGFQQWITTLLFQRFTAVIFT